MTYGILYEKFAKSPEVSVQAEEIPGWTHKLVIYFFKLPWAKREDVEPLINTVLVPTINAFEFFAGYTYLGHVLDWEGSTVTLYYYHRTESLSRLSFAPPLAAILGAIALILLAEGLIIMALAWFRRTELELREEITLEKLLEEGEITPEQYKEYKEAFRKRPPEWYEAIPKTIQYVIYGGVAIAVIGLVIQFMRR